jgi:hypothetical protein
LPQKKIIISQACVINEKVLNAIPANYICHLGGVVVSVLATGPKGCGFEPGKGDGFLRAIKTHSTPSDGK